MVGSDDGFGNLLCSYAPRGHLILSVLCESNGVHCVNNRGPEPLIIGAPAQAVLERQVLQYRRNARPYISPNSRSSMRTSTTTISAPIAVSMDTSDVLRNTVLLRLARLRPKKPRTTLLRFTCLPPLILASEARAVAQARASAHVRPKVLRNANEQETDTREDHRQQED